MSSNHNYIHAIAGEPRGWRYGSDMAIYTERFIDGRLLCASYQDNGTPIYTQHEHRDRPAFDLVVDGESLTFRWEVTGFTIRPGSNGVVSATLSLRHTRKPVELDVCTDACGFGFFRRSLRLRNTSSTQSLRLTSVTPLCGVLWAAADALKDNLRDRTVVPYSVGHFRDVEWGNEGNFLWQEIPTNTEIGYIGEMGKSGWSSPFFVLRNNLFGGYFVCHLAWSGNWRMNFYNDFWPNGGRTSLRFSIMPAAIPALRVIGPGETVGTPEVHFGLNHEDFDSAIQNLHGHLRANVLRKVSDGRQPVIVNHWSYMEHELTEERLRGEIDLAASIGGELFMVDAGWFGNIGKHWWDTTGDWQAGDRLPNDLFPVFDYARQKGLQCGLWVEIESAGKDSKLAADRPDWFIRRYGQKVDRILDLTKPEVAQYVESTIIRLIERYKLDMFRLDYNVSPMEGGFNLVAGAEENTLWRHVETMYAILDRVRARFPALQWENCAGGGSRTDIGMVSRATTTWVSDWMKMPRTVRILNGMSTALPPEYIDRLYGACMEGGYRGNTDTQMHVVLLAHPALSGLTPALAEANPVLLECVKKYIGIYKDFIRPFHREARVYHHTPEIPGADGTGWCALEYVSPDRRRAVAGVFRLMNAESDSYRLRFRGLNPDLAYRLTIAPGWTTDTVGGAVLMREGLDIRLDSAMTSRLLLADAVS